MKENLKVTLRQMITIIHRAINSTETKLLNHGEKVAYIMLNLLRAQGNYSDEEIINICAISIFHDIGAYKVGESDKLAEIDQSTTPFEHAIYGSLFIKYFSPLSDLYEIVLTHHFSHKFFKRKNMKAISKEGLLLNFADDIDFVYQNEKTSVKSYILGRQNDYLKEHISLFLEADKRFDFLNKIFNGSYVEELYGFFDSKVLSREEVIAYSKMLAYCIDFRSEATVKHTIIVEAISYQIAKLCDINKESLLEIKLAAALHDIGKIGISVDILEKPGKLTDEEFEIMKSHAIIGYNILSDLNIDDIRDIGTLHHEKLDGTGYPFGLREKEITKEMRIVAISDIVSALIGIRSYKNEFDKDNVIKILKNMINLNKIDSSITNLFIKNYDYIIKKALEDSKDLMDKYLNLNDEYRELLNYYA
ncbi:HD domain-containing phosphohydrolase [Clostridium sp. BL-8]|uniref:HD-GYP domain-containing protein n=1 Tax=Clostridium sp. BL-8 TaxID=349938 RepID=UPI00098CA2D6|nr:HD domain-containing phosphohydrolase [Clostridium sp. BL-8]OOM79483.1 cyclic di-GMP phosphodiesterase response regulator RpfG [Clostridium sp. BL-8]